MEPISPSEIKIVDTSKEYISKHLNEVIECINKQIPREWDISTIYISIYPGYSSINGSSRNAAKLNKLVAKKFKAKGWKVKAFSNKGWCPNNHIRIYRPGVSWLKRTLILIMGGL